MRILLHAFAVAFIAAATFFLWTGPSPAPPNERVYEGFNNEAAIREAQRQGFEFALKDGRPSVRNGALRLTRPPKQVFIDHNGNLRDYAEIERWHAIYRVMKADGTWRVESNGNQPPVLVDIKNNRLKVLLDGRLQSERTGRTYVVGADGGLQNDPSSAQTPPSQLGQQLGQLNSGVAAVRPLQPQNSSPAPAAPSGASANEAALLANGIIVRGPASGRYFERDTGREVTVSPGLNSGYQYVPNGTDVSGQLQGVFRAADGLLYDRAGRQVRLAASYTVPRAELKPGGRDLAETQIALGGVFRDSSGNLFIPRSGRQVEYDDNGVLQFAQGGIDAAAQFANAIFRADGLLYTQQGGNPVSLLYDPQNGWRYQVVNGARVDSGVYGYAQTTQQTQAGQLGQLPVAPPQQNPTVRALPPLPNNQN